MRIAPAVLIVCTLPTLVCAQPNLTDDMGPQLRVPSALVGVTFRFSSSTGKIEATASAA